MIIPFSGYQLFKKNVTSWHKIEFCVNPVRICLCVFYIIQIIAIIESIVDDVQMIIMFEIHIINSICHFFVILLQKAFIDGLN